MFLAAGNVRLLACLAAPEERLAGANLPPIGERDEKSVTVRYLNDRAASVYGGSNEIQNLGSSVEMTIELVLRERKPGT